MKFALCLLIVMQLLLQRAVCQGIFSTHEAFISFFSEAPISDVDARNRKVNVSLNTSSGALTFDIRMKAFEFRNAKMGRDAERKYIEIDKYPEAGFTGRIVSDIDYYKPGKYAATAKGTMTIHGVEQEVTERGTVSVRKNKIVLQSDFYISLEDYGIETPSILGHEMTEDKMLVKVEATLTPQGGK